MMNLSTMSEEDLIDLIMQCADELGWGCATPVMSDGADIPGIILGTDAYIDMMLEGSHE